MLNLNAIFTFSQTYGLWQGWSNTAPQAKRGLPQRFQWPAEAFRKYVQT